MKLTAAQERFLKEIRSHVDYRTIGRNMATAKRLEEAGYVEVQNGYFARLTEKGAAFLGRDLD